MVQVRHHQPNPRGTSDYIHHDPDVHFPKAYTINDSTSTHNSDGITVVDVHDLTEFSLFEQLYLIGKILGDPMPLKQSYPNV